MVERPETVRDRVLLWLRSVIASDPATYQDLDETALLDEVDETLSSDANIAALAERYGLPTPEDLEVAAGTQRGKEIEETRLEETREEQLDAAEAELLRQIEELPPGEAGAAIRELVDFRVNRLVQQLRAQGADAARIADLERRVKEAERRGERVARGVTERLAEVRAAVLPGRPLPAKPSAAEVLLQFRERERAIEERIDALVARGGAGGLQKNEARDLRRRVRAEREMLIKSFNADQLTPDELRERVAALLDAEDDEIAQLIAGRAEVEKPTVELVKPGRAPGIPGFPAARPGAPAAAPEGIERRLERIERILERERAPTFRDTAINLAKEFNRVRAEAPEFVAARLAEGATGAQIVAEYKRAGGFFPTR